MGNALINSLTYKLLSLQDMMKALGIIEVNQDIVRLDPKSFLETFTDYEKEETPTDYVILKKKVASLEYYCIAGEGEI